jgi:hypothetical protein
VKLFWKKNPPSAAPETNAAAEAVDDFELDIAGAIEGTDKSSASYLAWDYLSSYDRLFRPWRDKTINMIEIGIKEGNSVRLWHRFFKSAAIVGVDIDPQCKQWAGGRVVVEIGSQADPAFLARITGTYPPTIVLDDGSHQAEHIVFTFEHVFPKLEAGGVYVIEDLAFHFGPNAKKWNLSGAPPATEYFLNLARTIMARKQNPQGRQASAEIFESVESVEFIRSAAIIRKKPRKDVAKAAAFAAEYLKADAGTPDPERQLRFANFILRHNGQLEIAEAAVAEAIKMDGETASALLMRSRVQWRQGRLPGAVEDARRAAKARPGDAYYWRYLGQVERANGNLAAAAEAFRRTLKITPGDKNVAAQLEQLDAKFKAPVPESG